MRTSAAASTAPDKFTVTARPLQWTASSPSQSVQLEPGHLFFDFGRDAFGRLEIASRAGTAGRMIKVHLGEALAQPSAIDRNPGGSIRYHVTELSLGGDGEWQAVPLRPADARRMPSPADAVMPFRYVEIENAPPGFGVADLRRVVANYPFDDAAASFHCSDAKLNAIWDLCQYTMKATSFCGLFVDGDRERKPYEADAYINQLGWYACTTDWTLPRRTHEYLLQHATWPTEWSLFSVLIAWEDYVQTGNLTSARAFYDDLKRKTLIRLEREDGLISTIAPPVPPAVLASLHVSAMRDIVDWPAAERDGYEMKPINTVVNAFHCVALDRMAKLARALNQTADAEQFEAARRKATTSFNAKLFNAELGRYVDGEGSTHAAIHASFFPLAFGLVPAERRAGIVDFLKTRGMRCSVYGAQFLLEALFENGAADYARQLMTAPGDRSWTHMVDDVGTTITLEAWDNKYKPNQDWNHAWGAAPADLIPRELMGIKPLEPGWNRFAIAPRPAGLEFASLQIPSPHGPIRVRFENRTGFTLEVEIPPGSEAQIALPTESISPAEGEASVIVDGQPMKGIRSSDTLILPCPLRPGRHTISRLPRS